MQLTRFSDYALRITLYLAVNDDRLVSVEQISHAYGISRHHLIKIVQLLTELGIVEAVRGRRGGMRLAKSPEAINVGELVRRTEPHMDLVECFNMKTNTCPIAPACGLKGALFEAQRAFLESLDRHTLADFVPNREKLAPLWERAEKRNRRQMEKLTPSKPGG